MPTLVIKNLPHELHAALKQRAEANHRSLTKEAVMLLERGVVHEAQAPYPRTLPQPVRLHGGRLTIDDIEQAIAEGRDETP